MRKVFLLAPAVLGIALLSGLRPAAANPLTGVEAITVGSGHSCALMADGGVKCWGANAYGQVDGSDPVADPYVGSPTEPIPIDVPVLEGAASAITAGDGHSCALTGKGAVVCWGAGWAGQSPTAGMNSDVIEIASGYAHVCALTVQGAVKCWGGNWVGQLGDGTTQGGSTPVEVVGLQSGVAAIAAGGGRTCALTTEGGVKCWGANRTGLLGDGGACGAVCTTPVDVIGLESGVSAITVGGAHACALTTDGVLKCWGYNGYGGLGDGTTTNRPAPVDVVGLGGGVKAAVAGDSHTCAVTSAGALKCWGNNGWGQVGDGTSWNYHTRPVDVVGLSSGVTAAAAGFMHTCALTAESGVKCWGQDSSGALGDGGACGAGIFFVCPAPVDVVQLEPKGTPAPGGRTGDVDDDGVVGSADALLLLQYGAGLVESLPRPEAADVNADGGVTSVDAALILQHAAGVISHLVGEENGRS